MAVHLLGPSWSCMCIVFVYLYFCIFKKKAEVSVAVYSLGPGLPRMTSLLSPLHLFRQIASNVYFNHCPPTYFWADCLKYIFQPLPPSSFWAGCLKSIF